MNRHSVVCLLAVLCKLLAHCNYWDGNFRVKRAAWVAFDRSAALNRTCRFPVKQTSEVRTFIEAIVSRNLTKYFRITTIQTWYTCRLPISQKVRVHDLHCELSYSPQRHVLEQHKTVGFECHCFAVKWISALHQRRAVFVYSRRAHR